MIKVEIINKEDKVSKIIISGHALYDKYGKDIVCAAVSTATITTINNILSLNKSIEYLEEKDKLTIIVIKENPDTYKLLNNLIIMLKDLSKTYPQNVQII